jgi:hypothetical protein
MFRCWTGKTRHVRGRGRGIPRALDDHSQGADGLLTTLSRVLAGITEVREEITE